MATRRFPLAGKAIALVLVMLALLLALQAVSSIVAEREGRLREAERSVATSLASAQTIVGPLLSRSCIETWDTTQGEGKDRKTVLERDEYNLTASPATLAMKGDIALEPRHRGIFKVNGYVLKTRLVASWSDGGALVPQLRHPGARLQCDAPVLFVALGDSRGVRSAAVQIDGAPAVVLPGTTHGAHPRGFHATIADTYIGARRPLAAEVGIELVGTGELGVAPVGGSTEVVLSSDWPHPSFGGRFLPVERQVTETGFSARWRLNALATTAPQAAVEGAAPCRLDDNGAEVREEGRRGACIETFGVSFIDPVSPYVLSDRATKYGVLFIALTFAGVGAIEVLRRLRVHPIQYLLVGSALAVFFLLLVSLSEHLPFAAAYAIAAAACTTLLAFYAAFVLRGSRAGLAFGAAIAALYAAMYALLQLEQTALLLGSTMLFAVLAAVMVATRRIDWYGLFAQMRADSVGARLETAVTGPSPAAL